MFCKIKHNGNIEKFEINIIRDPLKVPKKCVVNSTCLRIAKFGDITYSCICSHTYCSIKFKFHEDKVVIQIAFYGGYIKKKIHF